MTYLEAVLSVPGLLPSYGYTLDRDGLNSVKTTPIFTNMLPISRLRHPMTEIRPRLKKTKLFLLSFTRLNILVSCFIALSRQVPAIVSTLYRNLSLLVAQVIYFYFK